jgi:hypothetical protein
MAEPSITLQECIDVQTEYLADPASIEPYKTTWKNDAKARYNAAKTQAVTEAEDSNDEGVHFDPYSITYTGLTADETISADTTVTADPLDYGNYTPLYETKNIDFYLDGTLSTSDNSTPFTQDILVAPLADGPHSLFVKAVDGMKVGHYDFLNFNVNTAPTLPAITLNVPADPVNKTITLTGSVGSDATFTPSFIKLYLVSYLGKEIWSGEVTSGFDSLAIDINTTLFENGEHKLFAIFGYDSGNSIVKEYTLTTENVPETTLPPPPIPGFEIFIVFPTFVALVAVVNRRRKKK